MKIKVTDPTREFTVGSHRANLLAIARRHDGKDERNILDAFRPYLKKYSVDGSPQKWMDWFIDNDVMKRVLS